jgi:ATP-dependent DNA ligase
MSAGPPALTPQTKAGFVEPMDCLPVRNLPEGSKWLWELKLDGFRVIAVKSAGKVRLYSRNSKPFDKKFAYIELPDETTVDGEIVALGDSGRPSFNLLQNFVSGAGRIRYFVFDLLWHKGPRPDWAAADREADDSSLNLVLAAERLSREVAVEHNVARIAVHNI